jgi:hypothetical protein
MKRRSLELLPFVFASINIELEVLHQNHEFLKT